jgi:hypothetical protein
MKKVLLFIAFTTFGNVYAQKLPNLQKASIWAPQNIKIDGKAAEWQDKYEAYNNATDINYTLSNDDKNLYLVIKATRKLVIGGKILAGGISFTVNHTLSKKDAAAITVTYPMLQGKGSGSVSDLFYAAAGMGVGFTSGGGNSLNRLNNTFTEKSKYIGIAGIKGVPDNEIPIYNNLDIKAASAFHEPAIYIYELAIPLALLALPEGGTQGFSYHIKMNISKEAMELFGSGRSRPIVNPGAPPEPMPAPEFITPTDFWGEYTLAKKP